MNKSVLLLCSTFLISGCASETVTTVETFKPGLGEIMSLTAMRHAKLWFAGQAENWALAAYELDELKEGIEDAEIFHPTHKHLKTAPMKSLIAATMENPVAALDKAIAAKNLIEFNKQYDQLTAGCNACHQMADFGFNVNVVTRPNFNPFANQNFSAH
ncbi:MAG: hypothetical protein PHQ03_09785 [Methylococcales bacterium]|nr:hypothetical protein [Methylococcales bacterium]